ncbi:hypothetical protein [Dyadobacter sp. 676]|uniref:Uncharacterized protein n=1 Tax=Dyadobacter sp. 676 TaxID=3088362 RepID=A0AAU8FLQ3_9BACT
MNRPELRQAIGLIYEGGINTASEELYNWLRPGRKKETLQTLFELLDYQNALIEVLEKELIDLRIEKSELKPKFYPMSYTPRKRY